MRRALVAVVVVLVCALFARAASAYCRTTTCDPADGDACEKDVDGCVIGGTPAGWNRRFVPYRFAKGTPAKVRAAFERAANQWSDAQCDATDRARAGKTRLLFGRLDDAPEGDTELVIGVEADISNGTELGLTTLEFGDTSGIVKSARMRIDRTAVDNGFDLDTVFLHEIGHYIGLAHSEHSDSVMQPMYGSIPRGGKLGEDDRLAVCVVYPPAPLTQLPPSCSAAVLDTDMDPTGPVVVVAGWTFVTVARRRRRIRLPAAR